MTLNSDVYDLIHKDSNQNNPTGVDGIIAKGILSLIRNKSFYGEILLHLNRNTDNTIDSFLALKWLNNQLKLAYNPIHLKEAVADSNDLIAILEHLAMHIVWLHPLRYVNHSLLNDVASDVAVNQYVSDVYSKGWTLDKINYQYNLDMKPNLDSSQYAKQLYDLFSQDKQDGVGKLDNDNLRIVDDHRYFDDEGNISNQDYEQRKESIDRLLRDVYSQYRGDLSMAVDKQIKSVVMPRINLQQIVRRITGNKSNRSKKTYNRFNRRQPYRMDIAGSIRRQSEHVNVFIDSSGSISDNQYANMVSVVKSIQSMPNIEVNCYTFDADVHAISNSLLSNQRLLQGGTKYQSIVDYVNEHKLSKQGCIVFTDGKGEEYLNHQNLHIAWVLLDYENKLSVHNQKDNVLYLDQIRM
ncbi:VWA-like domain-containing protein [Apilactobacillus nanyangensis]|uniref:VWA-like domain-containing protein n=1 Tax=Apilactobacillus nanyangensis TaxID=2799579 RepID=UPI001940C7AA|nr:VWA-like domain-containing protein [Apilactobacillus nanyangensis]